MAILKRIVPEPIIKDYREDNGSYYEAKCEQCDRIYYPKRNTSKYCSKQCGTYASKGMMLANPISNEVEKSFEEIRNNAKTIQDLENDFKGSILEKLKRERRFKK
jgi:hypothetical protein